MYLKEVEDIWVDETIRLVHWHKFISELREDWERSTTPVSVKLLDDDFLYLIHKIGHCVAHGKCKLFSYTKYRHGSRGRWSIGGANRKLCVNVVQSGQLHYLSSPP